MLVNRATGVFEPHHHFIAFFRHRHDGADLLSQLGHAAGANIAFKIQYKYTLPVCILLFRFILLFSILFFRLFPFFPGCFIQYRMLKKVRHFTIFVIQFLDGQPVCRWPSTGKSSDKN